MGYRKNNQIFCGLRLLKAGKREGNMSFKAYVIMDSPAQKTAQIVKTLRNRPGVVSVDLLEDSPQLIIVVEAPRRKKLAELTVQAISSANSMSAVMQLLPATTGKY
jgi:nitrate reductase NapAB chaperone NapD